MERNHYRRLAPPIACALTLAAAFLVHLPGAAQEPAAAPALVQPGQPVFDAASRQLTLAGTAETPDDLIIFCQIFYGEVAGPRQQAAVKAKKFRFDFAPVEKNRQFLPGKYSFKVACNLADQPPQLKEVLVNMPAIESTVEVIVGDPDEGARIKETVRTSYTKLLDELRVLYQTMESEASFTTGRAINVRTKSGGKVPEAEGKKIADLWESFCRRHVDERFRLHRLDFDELRKGCYIAPFPDVERDIENLLALLEKWYGACWSEIAKILDLTPPKTGESASFGKRDLLPQVLQTVERLYKSLGVEPEEWGQVNPFRPEEGAVAGKTYLSKTSKFRIDVPEGWEFNTEVVHTTVRIRLLPKDPEKAKDCVVAVELMDYPECENPKDLDTAVELATSERWPGFKKIKAGPFKAKDDKMPDGTRPGYSMLALCIEAKQGRFNVMEHALYCRWFKRTYTVVTICKEERWESVKEDVTKINNSFIVLDRAE